MIQRPAQIGFEKEFTVGGGLKGQDFRLDIEGNDISVEALASYIIQDLRLLMVGRVATIKQADHHRSA